MIYVLCTLKIIGHCIVLLIAHWVRISISRSMLALDIMLF